MTYFIFRRVGAFFIDYGLIFIYAGILFTIALLIQNITNQVISTVHDSPFKDQIFGFLVLTLPVFLYFYICERSAYKGTLGKIIFKIEVHSIKPGNTKKSIFIRNLLRFLPWEIAHTGVHWIIYYTSNNHQTPIWVFILLIVPQIIVILYFISIVVSKGQSSLYDKIAETTVVPAA